MNEKLLAALKSGDIKSVEELIGQGVQIPMPSTPYDINPLFIVVENGHTQLLDFLLTNQHCTLSPGNIRNKHNETLLHVAAEKGDLDTVNYLLTNTLTKTLFKVSDKNTAGESSLLLATCHGHLETVAYLLKHGNLTISDENSYGLTPLLAATYLGHIQLTLLLLEHGAVLDSVHCEGQLTPQMIAEKENKPTLPILNAAHRLFEEIENGGTPKKETMDILSTALYARRAKDGKTALELAISKSNFKAVQCLLKAETRSTQGSTRERKESKDKNESISLSSEKVESLKTGKQPFVLTQFNLKSTAGLSIELPGESDFPSLSPKRSPLSPDTAG